MSLEEVQLDNMPQMQMVPQQTQMTQMPQMPQMQYVPQPVMKPAGPTMSKQMQITYAICISILVIVIIILIIVICVKNQSSSATVVAVTPDNFEGYRPMKRRKEKYNQVETTDGIYDYTMKQQDKKLFTDINYAGQNKMIHPFMQEYFRPVRRQRQLPPQRPPRGLKK